MKSRINLILITFCLTCICLVNSCQKRWYHEDSFVCVCDTQACDALKVIHDLEPGQIYAYSSDAKELRFKKDKINISNHFDAKYEDQVEVIINPLHTYQKIIGFGGAFTDSSGVNIYSLSKNLSNQLIKDYYSKNGLDYNMARVPIGGTDFSLRGYTYNDGPEDFNLTNFALQPEDHIYKLPLIRLAKSYKPKLKLFASAWSAPAWMKTNNQLRGRGHLKGKPGGKYYQTWAEYYVKFLKAYASEGVQFWGITAQNEPTNINGVINSMIFLPSWQRDFIKLNLGPTLAKNGFDKNKLKLMILDDQLMLAPTWAKQILSDPESAQYVSGIAIHWYMNAITPRFLQDLTHNLYPNYFMISSEACEGSFSLAEKVSLGNWNNAESYALDIIQDLNHWTSAWVDWNIALNEHGGPLYVNNPTDAPIIVNASSNEYYKQPMYYALAHFTKFLPSDSLHIQSTLHGDTRRVHATAFRDPKGHVIVIVLNLNKKDKLIKIQGAYDNPIEYMVTARSITTFYGKSKV